MVSGTNEYLSSVRVKGRLGNRKELKLPERDGTRSWRTWLYIYSYRASVGGRGSPKEAVQAPRYI